MITIHKIPVQENNLFEAWIHEDWVFLTLMIQNGNPQIWVQVDDTKPKISYNFESHTTGIPISYAHRLTYLNSYSTDGCIHHIYVEREDLTIWYKIKKFLRFTRKVAPI
jgi:hypothetical protein